jgi:uncharacterized Rmd1/YagE family protein
MARLEGAYEQVSQRLMNIDPRFDALDRKINLLHEAVDKKIDMIDAKKIDQRFMWTVGIILTTWVTTMGTTIASICFHH